MENALSEWSLASSNRQCGRPIFYIGVMPPSAVFGPSVFNTIDLGPLPQEAIESTLYLSNDQITSVQGVVEHVFLEGFKSNTGILWDGLNYAVGTGTTDTFRYASNIHGGAGALISDGDNEIYGILGTRGDFTPPP